MQLNLHGIHEFAENLDKLSLYTHLGLNNKEKEDNVTIRYRDTVKT